jgi:hypothetical protein
MSALAYSSGAPKGFEHFNGVAALRLAAAPALHQSQGAECYPDRPRRPHWQASLSCSRPLALMGAAGAVGLIGRAGFGHSSLVNALRLPGSGRLPNWRAGLLVGG